MQFVPFKDFNGFKIRSNVANNPRGVVCQQYITSNLDFWSFKTKVCQVI